MDVEARMEWLSNEGLPRVNLAKARSEELVRDISEWRRPDPSRTSIHIKPAPECGWYVRLDSLEPPPRLEQWGLQLGEVAHHLRSNLNTTLTRIVRAEGLEPGKQLQYPIAHSQRAWRQAKRRGSLSGLPERVVRAIYACQPFLWARASGAFPQDHQLAVLGWLNNEDKHRLEISGSFAPSWVEHHGRILTPDGSSRAVRPRFTYDWSFTPGSRMVDADTSPFVVADLGRTTLDLQIEVLVPDERGQTTILEQLLSEIWDAFQQAVVGLIIAWADESIDVAGFAGASDFSAGASFGRAAVDSVVGPGAWDKDVMRQLTIDDPFGTEGAWRASTQTKLAARPNPVTHQPGRIEWEVLRGITDAHEPPPTWRGQGG